MHNLFFLKDLKRVDKVNQILELAMDLANQFIDLGTSINN